MDIALLMTAIGALVALTNIFVQVLKQLIGEVLPGSLVAFVVAIVLTLLAFFAWASYTQTAVQWYYIPGAVIAGVLVAYAAMFGFDKLKEIVDGLWKQGK